MTLIDIKNLTTTEMVELISKLEKEIAFRESVGNEISEQQEAFDRLKGIRNYPEGCFEYSITREP